MADGPGAVPHLEVQREAPAFGFVEVHDQLSRGGQPDAEHDPDAIEPRRDDVVGRLQVKVARVDEDQVIDLPDGPGVGVADLPQLGEELVDAALRALVHNNGLRLLVEREPTHCAEHLAVQHLVNLADAAGLEQ